MWIRKIEQLVRIVSLVVLWSKHWLGWQTAVSSLITCCLVWFDVSFNQKTHLVAGVFCLLLMIRLLSYNSVVIYLLVCLQKQKSYPSILVRDIIANRNMPLLLFLGLYLWVMNGHTVLVVFTFCFMLILLWHKPISETLLNLPFRTKRSWEIEIGRDGRARDSETAWRVLSFQVCFSSHLNIYRAC